LEDVRAPTFVSFLDFARWSAAAVVFAGHLRNPMFLGYKDLSNFDRNLIVQVWYFTTGWFAEAVIVFFVLSGFLVGGLACAKARENTFLLSSYSIDRITRLFLAFLPALILTALLDAIGSSAFSAAGFYDHTQPMIQQKVASEPFVSNMTLGIFAMNLAMLQTFFSPSYGSNQPLWTISAEFWFYVVFGAAMAGLMRGSWVKRAFGLGVVTLLTVVLGTQFVLLLGLWLVGVVTVFMPRSLERPLIAFILFVAVLAIVRIKHDVFEATPLLHRLKDYVVAVAFAWLLISMRSVRFRLLERLGSLNRFLANFSYSLYLIHFPLMLFILAGLHATGRFTDIAVGYRPTDVEGVTIYVTMIILVYAISWGFSVLTERNTERLRDFVNRRIRQRSIASRGNAP